MGSTKASSVRSKLLLQSGNLQRDWGRTSGTMCTCEEIERGTHAYRASKLGPVKRSWTQDEKLGITIQDPAPESGRRTHLLYFFICIAFCHVSENFPLVPCFTILWTSISVFYVNTAHDVITVLLIFAKYLSLYLHIFTCTYRDTHTQAHMYNQHTRGMETTRHRSLVERAGRRALWETIHSHTKNKNKKNSETKPIFTNLKEKIRAHRVSSQATRLFLTKS